MKLLKAKPLISEKNNERLKGRSLGFKLQQFVKKDFAETKPAKKPERSLKGLFAKKFLLTTF